MKGRLALLLSLGAGIFAVIAVFLYLQIQRSTLLQQAALQDVVVATQDILANTIIDERVVQVRRVPRTYLQPTAITSLDKAIGLVTAVPIPRNSQVLGVALQEGGRLGLSLEVPRGMRAVTIAIDDVTGVAGLVRPGDFVDLVGTFEYGVPTGNVGGQITYSQEKTETLTLAQNVQVVASGVEHRGARPEARQASEAEAEDRENDRQPQRTRVENVTVLVTPQQVQEIVLAQQIGALTISLRSKLDAGRVVDLQRIDPLTMLKVPMPLKPRAQPSWREIRGSQF